MNQLLCSVYFPSLVLLLVIVLVLDSITSTSTTRSDRAEAPSLRPNVGDANLPP